MPGRDPGNNHEQRPARAEAGAARALGALAVAVLLLVVAAAGVVWWRPGLIDSFRGDEPTADPTSDPAAVAPPAGLDLPAPEVPEPVADAADVGAALDPAAVRRAVRGPLGDGALGRHVIAGVATLGGGEPVLLRDQDAAIPASTTKLATSVAALEALGGERRFATTAVSATRGEVTLVGGGDPLLARAPLADPDTGEPVPADLRTLADETAAALAEDGVRRVAVTYDDTLFSGPRASPTWEDDYLPSGVVSPISALWADRGVGPDGVRETEPSLAAARAFAAALRDAGIRTPGEPTRSPAPATADELARVESPPVGLLVEHLNRTSDNEVGEVLAHQVGLAVEQEGSFAAGSRAVVATLRDLGVDMTDVELNDGSGLSRANRLTATALTDLLALAAEPRRATLRPVLTGLPVAGFSGSLEFRFDVVDPVALGAVRAKTGTLTGVSGLSGTVVTADGAVASFAVVADRIRPDRTSFAIRAVERAVAALAACRCRA